MPSFRSDSRASSFSISAAFAASSCTNESVVVRYKGCVPSMVGRAKHWHPKPGECFSNRQLSSYKVAEGPTLMAAAAKGSRGTGF